MITINIVLKIKKENIIDFEDKLRESFQVIDLKVLPNTEQLYNDNTTFQKLVKNVKKAQRKRDIFINEHN